MRRFRSACLIALAGTLPLCAQIPDEPAPLPPINFNPPIPKMIAPPLGATAMPSGETTYQTVYPPHDAGGDVSSPFAFTTAQTFNDYQFWGGADYTLWWFRKMPIAAPLAVTTTSPPGPGANILGIDPNARVILGPDQVANDPSNGARLWLGVWFDPERRLGFEVGGMWVESPTALMTVRSDDRGFPLLSRPIVVPGGGPGVYDIGYADVTRGTFSVQSYQLLQSLEANFVGFGLGNHRLAFELLAGGRFINLEDTINLNYQVTNLVAMPAFGGDVLSPGTTVEAVDRYRTTNQFYGGQIGGRVESNLGRLSLAFTGKVAFGVNDMSLHVDGTTMRTDATTTYAAGILANAENIGRYRQTHYAYVPEGNLAVGWWFTPNLRLKVGYNILYISEVIRAGSHISNAVNPFAVPADQSFGAGVVTRTSPQFQRTDFWAEGITFGIDFRY